LKAKCFTNFCFQLKSKIYANLHCNQVCERDGWRIPERDRESVGISYILWPNSMLVINSENPIMANFSQSLRSSIHIAISLACPVAVSFVCVCVLTCEARCLCKCEVDWLWLCGCIYKWYAEHAINKGKIQCRRIGLELRFYTKKKNFGSDTSVLAKYIMIKI